MNLGFENEFKDLIINTLGIISNTERNIHTKITSDPIKNDYEINYGEKFFWKFEPKAQVPWLCIWNKKLASEPSKGIYPIFYFYKGKKENKEFKYIILSFGKSVKNKNKVNWDSSLELKEINDFFNIIKLEEISTYKNEINYGTSFIYKVYDITNENTMNDEKFQNLIFNDFKTFLDYYITYAKYIKNESSIEIKKEYEEKLKEIKKILKISYEGIFKDENKEEKYIRFKELDESKNNFYFPLNSILFGPPGTGKTYSSIFYSVGIIEKNNLIINNKISYNEELIFEKYKKYQEEGLIKFITFHQSYSYEDFIEGIRPNLTNSNELEYELSIGIFKEICNNAQKNLEKNYVLIIDEINRGNISKIFGELITLIEASKRLEEKEEIKVILPYSKEKFGVPRNLYILGTMNTADRSIALFDMAFRRRFDFIEIMPQAKLLKDKIIENINLELLLSAINDRIEFFIDRDHTIGHSYFLNIKNFENLSNIFQKSIIPLLQEYFYDDYKKIKEVLGNNGFIVSQTINLNPKNSKKEILKFNFEALKNIENYIKIYENDSEDD